MHQIVKQAFKYWEKRNCARSTSCAILDYYGFSEYTNVLDSAMILFGGGAGERSICGSLLGALAGMGVVLKEKGLEEKEIYKKSKYLKAGFKKEMGTLRCREILADFLDENGVLDKDHPDRSPLCDKTVETAVLEVLRIIDNI
ncbi:MAG: C_GCAxxG_C_C family protein [Candidatus Heimdallarchaeota archaeon]|nr:C_GCAxxG_C_C family protein [Candidatus Heimdallarchaeota archaeon]MCK4954673.1 C_GCAxxG_C_C family protein [Candidatus Heimdallarchaeota archaeon]